MENKDMEQSAMNSAAQLSEEELQKVGGGASKTVFRCPKCGKMYGSETMMKDGKRVCSFCGLPVVQTNENMNFR